MNDLLSKRLAGQVIERSPRIPQPLLDQPGIHVRAFQRPEGLRDERDVRHTVTIGKAGSKPEPGLGMALAPCVSLSTPQGRVSVAHFGG